MALASRLCSKLSVRNLPALTAEDAVTVLDAMTSGIKEWFDKLPPTKKQTRVSEIVRAPLTLILNVVDGSKGFNYVSPPFPTGGYATETELLGKTISFNTAGPLNRLDKSNTFMKPYMGANGSQSAIFYGDAISFPSTSVRLVTPPIWEGEFSGRWELVSAPGEFYPSLLSWGSVGRSPELGPPRYYQTGALNPTLNSARDWFMRIWPLPNMRGTVTFTLETTPPVFGLDALQVPVDIPIPDEDMPDVIPMCEDRLTGTQLWSPQADRQKAYADAARSRDRVERKWFPLDAGAVDIATPANW